MPPFWPFKKKQVIAELDEAPPAPVVYKRGEDPNARKSIATDTGAYKDALALFGGGSAEVKAASDQSLRYDGATDKSNGIQNESNQSAISNVEEESSMNQPLRSLGFITPMAIITNNSSTVRLTRRLTSRTLTELTHRIRDQTIGELAEPTPGGRCSRC